MISWYKINNTYCRLHLLEWRYFSIFAIIFNLYNRNFSLCISLRRCLSIKNITGICKMALVILLLFSYYFITLHPYQDKDYSYHTRKLCAPCQSTPLTRSKHFSDFLWKLLLREFYLCPSIKFSYLWKIFINPKVFILIYMLHAFG